MLVLLTARLAHEQPDVLMVSMTPGLVRTGLGRHSPRWRRLVLALAKSTSKRPDAAARDLLHLALAPAAELAPGGFYRRGRLARPRVLEGVDAEAAWRSALLQLRDPRR